MGWQVRFLAKERFCEPFCLWTLGIEWRCSEKGLVINGPRRLLRGKLRLLALESFRDTFWETPPFFFFLVKAYLLENWKEDIKSLCHLSAVRVMASDSRRQERVSCTEQQKQHHGNYRGNRQLSRSKNVCEPPKTHRKGTGMSIFRIPNWNPILPWLPPKLISREIRVTQG